MPVLTANRANIRVRTFNGGQNSAAEPTIGRDDQATRLENTIITQLGKAEMREGLTCIGDNPDTLVSRWSFDASTAVDDKGDNDGTGTAITYVDGKFGKAASFNGTTSNIKVDADTTIDVNVMDAFRISAWVYVDSDGENDVGRIVDKFSGTDVGYRLWVHTESSSTVKLSFEVGHATTNAVRTPDTTMSTGAWHKVDAIYNTDNTADIYIDGVEATGGTDTTGDGGLSTDTTVDLYIGNNSAGSATFDGEIDEVRIYNGDFVLDDIEIDKIQGIFHYEVRTTKDIVVRIKNTDLQKLDADLKGWTNIDTGFTADKETNFFQAKDLLFILNGTDNVHTMDSNETVTDEADTDTDPPKGTFGEYAANNRAFISGVQTDDDRDTVYFSNTLDPQTWVRSLNKFDVAKGEGGKITWLKNFKEFELIIYKERRIYVLNMLGSIPLTDWEVKPLSVAVGCPAGRTVADIGNDHIFLSTDGFRLLSRTSFDKIRVGIISEPIQDIIDDINQDAIESSVGFFENSLYVVGVPTGTSTVPNTFLIWDSLVAARNGDPNTAWSVIPEDTWKLSCLTSYGFGDNKLTLVGGDADETSLTYKVLSGNTDNGAMIEQIIVGKDHDFGDRFIDKIFDPIQVVAQTGSDDTYSIDAEVDRGGFVQVGSLDLAGSLQTPFTTPATTGGSERRVTTFRSKHLGRGKSCRLRIKNNVYNKKPTFVEYTMYARPYQGRLT